MNNKKDPTSVGDVLTRLNIMGIVMREIIPAVNTDAYTAEDVLFAATMEIERAATVKGGGGFIASVGLVDNGKQEADIDLLFFRSDVSAGTINAAEAISKTNGLQLIGKVNLSSYRTFANFSRAQKENINLPFECEEGSKKIYVTAVVNGTPTYLTAADLTLYVGIYRY